MRLLKMLVIVTLAAGCAVQSSGQTDSRQPQPTPRPTASKPAAPSTTKVDPAVVERLQRVMTRSWSKMNKPRSPSEVKIGIMDDPHINAASAGNGEFYVTTGLLAKADDDQMRRRARPRARPRRSRPRRQGAAPGRRASDRHGLLDQIIPGSGNLTPIAGG